MKEMVATLVVRGVHVLADNGNISSEARRREKVDIQRASFLRRISCANSVRYVTVTETAYWLF